MPAGTRPGPVHRLASRCGIRRKAHPALAICGTYNIISRNLGLERGGAVGLSLFLSQAFSVTLYAFGLAESVRFIWPGAPVGPTAFVIVLGIGVLASELRIKARTDILIKPDDMTVREVIFAQSETADVTFLGLPVPEVGEETEAAQRMAGMAEGLPTVFFVNNSSPFGGELVET